jgi:S1-C subfamily serine protease
MQRKLKDLLAVIFVLTNCLILSSWADANQQDAVVKLFVTANSMDFYRPWQSIGSQAASGSGCVIAGQRILTNAHVIADSTFIQVRKESDPKKYTAQVLAVGHDCDLALLAVNDAEFFSGITPFEFGGLPQLQDMVSVVGFPMGGDKISITQGVVSRIEVNPYAESAKKLLAVQIDAPINPGNSGGPVLQDGKVVGIAMQLISESQNIGYMIPTPIIAHFLKDLEDGKYDEFPILGIEFLNTENKALRKLYHIEDQNGGVLVNNITPFTSADGLLQEGDVILALDGTPIGVDGTFAFRNNERLLLSQLISSKQSGEVVVVSIARRGKIMAVNVPLKSSVGIIPYPNYFKKPSYYIYGGLVFTVLSADLLQAWGKNWWEKAPIDFMNYLIGKGRLNPERKKEVVVLLEVLPDDINVGYHDFRNEVIAQVNGKSFKSFEEFITLLERNKEDYLIFETEQRIKIILSTERIDDITQTILKRNNIPRQFSDDVALWITDSKL